MKLLAASATQNGCILGGQGVARNLPAAFIQPVGKPFFIKRVTDHYAKGRSDIKLVRRTVDSTLVQYFQILQNGCGRLPDGDDTAAPVSAFHGGSYGV